MKNRIRLIEFSPFSQDRQLRSLPINMYFNRGNKGFAVVVAIVVVVVVVTRFLFLKEPQILSTFNVIKFLATSILNCSYQFCSMSGLN